MKFGRLSFYGLDKVHVLIFEQGNVISERSTRFIGQMNETEKHVPGDYD